MEKRCPTRKETNIKNGSSKHRKGCWKQKHAASRARGGGGFLRSANENGQDDILAQGSGAVMGEKNGDYAKGPKWRGRRQDTFILGSRLLVSRAPSCSSIMCGVRAFSANGAGW